MVWVIDKGMQRFKKIYAVIMKLNRFYALHLVVNNLCYIEGSQHISSGEIRKNVSELSLFPHLICNVETNRRET